MTWLNLVELSKLSQFSEILTQVSGQSLFPTLNVSRQISCNDKGWKAWFDTEAPEESTIPDGYNSLDTFRKLLLVR